MNKQEKRAKTLIEYMGFKDPDLFQPDHDTWCLKFLNNKKLCRKIFKQVIDSRKSNESIHLEKNEEGIFSQASTYSISDYKYHGVFNYDTFTEDKTQLEYVIVKNGSNGFSQRLGFIDVLYSIICIPTIEYLEKEVKLNPKRINLFFEIKTKKETIGAITREVEYYRSAINETLRGVSYPVVISPEKIPIDQFDSFSFDEIIQLEKEVLK